MLYRTAILLLLLSGAAPALPAQTPAASIPPKTSWENQQRWADQADLDGRFRIFTPARLEEATDTLETAVGRQVFHTFFYEVPDPAKADNVIYALSYVDYPAGALHHDSTDLVSELLATTEEAATEAVNGEVIYSRELSVSGYPARQWRIDYRDGEASARTLAIVAHNRYYEVKTFALKTRGINRSNKRFFDGLELFAPNNSPRRRLGAKKPPRPREQATLPDGQIRPQRR